MRRPRWHRLLPRWLRERLELRGVPTMNDHWIEGMTHNGHLLMVMEGRRRTENEVMEWDDE